MIPLAECKKRGIYRIRSRNLSIGVFDGDRGLVGIREKFGDRYLDTEFHRDSAGGTAVPLELIGQLPEEILLDEYLESVDQETLRQVDFSQKFKQDPEIGWGWYWLDTGKPDPERKIKAMAVRNKVLFEYLDKLEDA